MSKIITVFGATGNQGGSVIAAILDDPKLSAEYKIRAITRDTSKPAAQQLANKGCELVSADMNSTDSVTKAIKGSHTVFLVTNYWETGKAEDEIRQGNNVVDAAKECGISHMIFSTLVDVKKTTQGRLSHVDHWDGKAQIADYIRKTGLPSSFVLPGYFMSGLVQQFQKSEDGMYSIAYPIGKQSKFPLIDIAEDLGKFVLPTLRDPEKYKGGEILAAQEYYTLDRILSEFDEVTGKKLNYTQVSNDQYKGFLPDFMGEEMLENHLMIEEPGYYNGAELKESLDAVPEKLTTWKEFLSKSGPY